MPKSGNYCGNKDCCVSTGICERTTFGSGMLDNNGYWEHPCIICAAVSQKFSPSIEVWPDPGKNAIPAWAGQATPGAQLTCLRSAMLGHLSNLKEGCITPKEAVKKLTSLLNKQMREMEDHLQHKSW